MSVCVLCVYVYLTYLHGIYMLKYLPLFSECLYEIVRIGLSFASPSQYLSMTSPLSPSLTYQSSHTCMPFNCNQLPYLGHRSTHTRTASLASVSCMTFQWFFLLVHLVTSQPVPEQSLSPDPQKPDLPQSPTTDIC